MWGAETVWVGTNFVAAVEVSAPKKHKKLICSAGFEDAVTTLIFAGRPLRVRRTPYIEDWSQAKIKELTEKGKLPYEVELEKRPEMLQRGHKYLDPRCDS
ncbi:hypothetical protein B0H13DRAFT_2139044, partial [Mycena leptocephala]